MADSRRRSDSASGHTKEVTVNADRENTQKKKSFEVTPPFPPPPLSEIVPGQKQCVLLVTVYTRPKAFGM